MIKAAKRSIRSILGNAEVDDDELNTAIAAAESLINSRPLTRPSEDPNDRMTLTPNHFLHGCEGGDVAPETVDILDFHPRQRWRYVQDLTRQFWTRWMKEILPQLSGRKKWYDGNPNLKIDDIVLEIDPNSPRRDWKLARITQIYPGEDSVVRVVEIMVAGKRYKRPVHRLCKLEYE